VVHFLHAQRFVAGFADDVIVIPTWEVHYY
jgi:hypothetical protein